MFGRILAVVLTLAGIGGIVYILNAVKGLKVKYGVVGMILIFMPFSLGIGFASSGGELKYNIIMLISVLIGFVFFVSDIPKR